MDLAVGPLGRARERPFRHVDGVLLVTVLALSVIGLFMVYASSHALSAFGVDPTAFVKKQLAWLVLSCAVLLISIAFDYRYAKVYAGFIYAGMLL